jgi:molybdopterin converting factor subunit 1
MRILLFAHLKDVVARHEIELPVNAPVRADELWQRLLARHPQLEPFRKSIRLAQNGEYASADATFTNSDEVALIPPVSGG